MPFSVFLWHEINQSSYITLTYITYNKRSMFTVALPDEDVVASIEVVVDLVVVITGVVTVIIGVVVVIHK